MIEHAHERLVAWADWALSDRCAKGLGYPGCTLARWAVPASGFRPDPNLDRDAIESDDAIRAMREDHRLVLVTYYLGRGTQDQKAADLKCSRATLYRWLDDARAAFVAVLREREYQRHRIVIEKSSFR